MGGEGQMLSMTSEQCDYTHRRGQRSVFGGTVTKVVGLEEEWKFNLKDGQWECVEMYYHCL